jgi:hypothetical protein
MSSFVWSLVDHLHWRCVSSHVASSILALSSLVSSRVVVDRITCINAPFADVTHRCRPRSIHGHHSSCVPSKSSMGVVACTYEPAGHGRGTIAPAGQKLPSGHTVGSSGPCAAQSVPDRRSRWHAGVGAQIVGQVVLSWTSIANGHRYPGGHVGVGDRHSTADPSGHGCVAAMVAPKTETRQRFVHACNLGSS